MSLIEIIETILIGPLKLIFEVVFSFAIRFVGHPGLAIILLSLAINVLVLPLYKRADAMQELARDTEAKLAKGLKHIKNTFSGDERMMIQQVYYRQNNYSPLSSLRGSVSLLLEIPFFMAAYRFLSGLTLIQGISFGPIKDLGQPDGLITIGDFSINLLPILMTLVNVISSSIYLKGFPLKTKIQLYGMAAFFLVFLYDSPACLVFYWTLNNVFSLVKTVLLKLDNSKVIINVTLSVAGFALLMYLLFGWGRMDFIQMGVFGGSGLLLQIPLIVFLVKRKSKKQRVKKEFCSNKSLFTWASIFMTVLVGVMIPATYVAASPQEYIDINLLNNPLYFVLSAACLAVGTFLVWTRVFYWLASPRAKAIFERVMLMLGGAMLVDYLFFGTKLGVISPSLQYITGMSFTYIEVIINLLVILAVMGLLLFIAVKGKKAAATVMLVASLAMTAMSGLSIVNAQKSIKTVLENPDFTSDFKLPEFKISRNGKNVVVITLDRAMGIYVPYMMAEKPELKEMFAGFTYYPNTISFAMFTNLAMPAVMGGYEYTPVEMNKRDTERLVDKHNEALLMMPVAFMNDGYNVTVTDPPYANYEWVANLSIYERYPDISTYITKYKFDETGTGENAVKNNMRNFFCFSLMKTMPLLIQPVLYNRGNYNMADYATQSSQTVESTSKAYSMNGVFLGAYNVLASLPAMTRFCEGDTFLSFYNDAPHEPMLTQTPDYTPALIVDNTEYDAAHNDRFTVDGRTIDMTQPIHMTHYHANMASMIQLGKWFDFLRENDVYDNTRIIIVSDHGRDLGQMKDLIYRQGKDKVDLTAYMPLLMVKDFGATEYTVSDQFMTNADVPTLAMTGAIENPTNPFTGKPVNNNDKTDHPQFISRSIDWDVNINAGKAFSASSWISVESDVTDMDNWHLFKRPVVLKEHVGY